jgi:hypothetical protein
MSDEHGYMPNSTQVPNNFFDEWLPLLKEGEMKVLLIIIRQTLGWVEDKETGRRKEKDWISNRQMAIKTGLGSRSISRAIATLIQKGLIETWGDGGIRLDTSAERKKAGMRIFYRLKTATAKQEPSPIWRRLKKRPEIRLKKDEKKNPSQFGEGTLVNLAIYKRNSIQNKINTSAAMPLRRPKKNEVREHQESLKPKSPHRAFIEFWYANVEQARKIKPAISPRDGAMLKKVLAAGVSPETLEKATIYFLHEPGFRTFSPSISVMLSAGVLNAIQNRIQNDPGFWKAMDRYIADQGGIASPSDKNPKAIATMTADIVKMRHALAAAFAAPKTAVAAE